MATTAKPLTTTQEKTGRIAGVRRLFANALIITRREVRDSFRDWRILAPIVVLTFVFPFLAQFLGAQFRGFIAGYGGAEIIGDRTFPFLLMVVGFFPISISLVIALETFVGEKERRSLEPLLSTPLSNTELYLGKTLSAMIPPLISSYGGMFVFLISLMIGEGWRPQFMLIVQIVLLTTVQALVMVTGAVVVSSQTTSTRAANLLASFIIIPMALLVQGEALIMFVAPDAGSWAGIRALWAIVFGMLVVAVLLLRVGNSIFNREELLGSTVDQLKLSGIFWKLWRYIRAYDDEGTPARNLLEWYRRSIPYTLSTLKLPLMMTVGVFVAAVAAGAIFGSIPRWQIPFDAITTEREVASSADGVGSFFGTNFQNPETVRFIFVQNSRVLLGTLLLSLFTFGVFALVIPPITFAVLGYLVAQVIAAGFSPLDLLAALLPHGILEIPLIALAAAMALAMGAVVTRPPRGDTVGNAWMRRFGDTVKVFIGVILPGLIIAAIVEAYITPEVVQWVLAN